MHLDTILNTVLNTILNAISKTIWFWTGFWTWVQVATTFLFPRSKFGRFSFYIFTFAKTNLWFCCKVFCHPCEHINFQCDLWVFFVWDGVIPHCFENDNSDGVQCYKSQHLKICSCFSTLREHAFFTWFPITYIPKPIAATPVIVSIEIIILTPLLYFLPSLFLLFLSAVNISWISPIFWRRYEWSSRKASISSKSILLIIYNFVLDTWRL